MAKFKVYGKMTGWVSVGEFEAETEKEAIKKAEEVATEPSMCWQCAGEVDLGDIYEFEAEKLDNPEG